MIRFEKMDILSDELIGMILLLWANRTDPEKTKNTKERIKSFLKSNEKHAREIVNTIGRCLVCTPLIAACRHLSAEMVEIVEELIKVGADVNMRTRYNHSPLYEIMYHYKFWPRRLFEEYKSSKMIMKMLVKNGADSNEIQKDRHSAFVSTIYYMKKVDDDDADDDDDYDLLDCMIKYGANVTKKISHQTLLMDFCDNKNKRMMKYLIKNGVDVNAQDKRGKTALMYCVESKQLEAIDILLESGADIYLRNIDGKTAIELYPIKVYSKPSLNSPNIYSTNLSVAYLKPFCTYFENLTPEKIQHNIGEYLRTRNEEIFPIKKYHLAAIESLISLIRERSNINWEKDLKLSEEEFKQKIEMLRYLNSEDFKTKLYADVINQISEDNAQIEGQLVIGMRARAKSEQDKENIDNIIDQLKLKEKLAIDFFTASEELSKLVWND